jgi:hypothetical protein
MKQRLRNILTTAALAASAAAWSGGAYASSSRYVQTNLISNDTSKFPAEHQDKLW